jgi:FkbM family methyltransferase
MSILRYSPKSLRNTGRAVCGMLGSACLAAPFTRNLLNRQLAKRDYSDSRWLDRFFRDAKVWRPFIWRYGFGAGTILLPVEKRLPRSWRVAISMHNHEPEVTRFWLEYLSVHEGGVFFDIGANYGIHGYRFLSQGYKCVLFEPQAECVSYIRKVASLNRWSPLIVEDLVGERTGTASFYQSASTWFSSRSSEWVLQCGEQPVAAERGMVTLDEFCERTGMAPNLIKIDVEGGEAFVLQGARACLNRHRPTVVCEVWRHSSNRDAVWDRMAPHGYAAFALRRESLTPIRDRTEFSDSDSADFVFTCDSELQRTLASHSGRSWISAAPRRRSP